MTEEKLISLTTTTIPRDRSDAQYTCPFLGSSLQNSIKSVEKAGSFSGHHSGLKNRVFLCEWNSVAKIMFWGI